MYITTRNNEVLQYLPKISLLVMPFSVTVVAIVNKGIGKIKLCLITRGMDGAEKDENTVALVCFLPSYISIAAISCLRDFVL